MSALLGQQKNIWRNTYRLQTNAGRVVLGFARDLSIPVCVYELSGYRHGPLSLRLVPQAEEGISGVLLTHFLIDPAIVRLKV